MSLKELDLVVQNYNTVFEEEQKMRRADNYEQALLTASFVGAMFSGNKIPEIDELYPHYFEDEEKEQKKMAFLKDQFTAYVERINAQRHKQGQESDK